MSLFSLFLALFNAVVWLYVLPVAISRCWKRRKILKERAAILKERYKLLSDLPNITGFEQRNAWQEKFDDTCKRFADTTHRYEKIRGFLW